MKKVIIGFGVFVGFVSILAISVFIGLSGNMKEIRSIDVGNLDFADYEDGVYQGEYYYKDEIGARVELTIQDGEITGITFLDHKYGLGGKAEIITEDIISNQTLDVDAISGATTSSHIIKLAVQNALEGNE